MGRRLRTRVPMLPSHRNPGQCCLQEAAAKDRKVRKEQSRHFDRRHRSKNLPKLEAGDVVWVTDLRTKGTVLGAAPQPRSYRVQTENGVEVRRNRRMLNRLPKDRVDSGNYEFPDSQEQPSRAGLVTGVDNQFDEAPEALVPLTQTETDGGNSQARIVTTTRFGRVVRKPIRLGVDD